MMLPIIVLPSALRSRYPLSLIEDGVFRFSDFTFDCNAIRNTFDADGLLQSVAVDTPRTVWIDGVPLFWVDGQVTEISGRSDDIDNWGVGTPSAFVNDAVGLDGEANTAWTGTDAESGSTVFAQKNTSSISGTNTYFAVFAVGFNATPSVYPQIGVTISGGTILRQRIVLDPSDGTYAEVFDDGAVVLVERFGDFWLVTLSLTDNDSGNTSCNIRLDPAYNTDGTTTEDVTAQGATVFGYCGLFKDNWSLLPVQTTGGTTKAVPVELAVVDLGSWFNQNAFSFVIEFWRPAAITGNLIDLRNLSGSNRFTLDLNSTGALQLSGPGVSAVGGAASYGTLQKAGLVVTTNRAEIYLNGSRVGLDGALIMPGDLINMRIGRRGTVFPAFTGFRNITAYPTAKLQAEMEALTTL